MKNKTWYIEFLNKEKNFIKDKVTFNSENSFNQAIEWGRKNLENFHIDMVKFEY